MKHWLIVVLLLLTLGMMRVQAQSTETPTPTPTSTPTATPTPTPDVGVRWQLSSGQWVEYAYETTASDSLIVPLLVAILISMWGSFFIVLVAMRRK